MIPFFVRVATQFFYEWGQVTLLIGQVISRLFRRRARYLNRTVDQMVHLGVNSMGITIVTALFVGMAFTVQVAKEFLKFGAGKMVGGIVGLAVWRELGPLLTGVVICGRVGAAIAAEIGTMKVTEQVEALESMSQDVVEYLVVPRVLATTLMMPLLVGMADLVGFFGGFLVALGTGRVNPFAFLDSAESMLIPVDIWGGLIKAALFGFIIAVICSYMGLNTKSGAKGVGEMTTKAVVVSLVAVFVLNYFLSLVIY